MRFQCPLAAVGRRPRAGPAVAAGAVCPAEVDPRVCLLCWWFDFARTATNVAAALASPVAFLTDANCDADKGFFASATTCNAGSRSLAMAFRAQGFCWHLASCVRFLPLLQYLRQLGDIGRDPPRFVAGQRLKLSLGAARQHRNRSGEHKALKYILNRS
jgi:hypothetical protein